MKSFSATELESILASMKLLSSENLAFLNHDVVKSTIDFYLVWLRDYSDAKAKNSLVNIVLSSEARRYFLLQAAGLLFENTLDQQANTPTYKLQSGDNEPLDDSDWVDVEEEDEYRALRVVAEISLARRRKFLNDCPLLSRNVWQESQ